MAKKPTGYELSRAWWDWCFENPEKVRPIHCAIYTFAIEHCNRLAWKEKFGFPSQMVMDAIGVKKHHTFIKALHEIVEFGFIEMVQKSKNQYSANIISIFSTHAMPKKGSTLTKAMVKHRTKHGQSNGSGTGCIDKPLTKKPFKPPTIQDVSDYCLERNNNIDAEEFIDHYTANGWMRGKNKVKDWKACVRTWERNTTKEKTTMTWQDKKALEWETSNGR